MGGGGEGGGGGGGELFITTYASYIKALTLHADSIITIKDKPSHLLILHYIYIYIL